MNDTTHTPHVNPAWAEVFVRELRMLDVPGHRIGHALADVEAYCADSGESAEEAFGDAVAYARDLDLPRADSRFSTVEMLGHGAGLLGMFVSVYALGAWATREPVSFTLGLLVSAVTLLIALAAMLRRPEALMRALVDRPWLLLVANLVVVGGVASLLLGLDASVFELPALPVASAGVLLVAASTVSALRSQAGDQDDRVLGPDGADGVGSLEVGRRFGVLARLGPWVPAIATLVLGGLTSLLRLA